MILFTGYVDDARAISSDPNPILLWRANVAIDFLTYKSMVHIWADFHIFTVNLGYLE